MQNQDPTADTDPNEYINQLVQVNSLEQLIDINQTLSTALGSTTASSDTEASTQAAQATPGVTGANLNGSGATSATRSALHRTGALSMAQSGTRQAVRQQRRVWQQHALPAILSVPGTNAAAQRVAHALDGRTRAQPGAGGFSAGQ